MSVTRRLLPGLAISLGSLVFIAGLVVPVLRRDAIVAGDVYTHVRLGREILAHHGLPSTDSLSFTKAGEPYVNYEWGYSILIALLDRALGSDGYVLLAALAGAAATALLARRFQARRLSLGATVPALALAALICRQTYCARPHMLSYVFFAAGLSLIDLASIRRWIFKPAWAAPLVCFAAVALWTCVHPASMLFFAVLALELGAAVALRKTTMARAGMILGCAALGLLATPWGWKVPWTVLAFIQEPTFARTINEHDALPLDWTVGAPVLLFLSSAMISFVFDCFAGVAGLKAAARARPGEWLTLLFLAALTIHGRRWGGFLAVACAPLAFRWVDFVFRPEGTAPAAAAETRARPLTRADAAWPTALVVTALVALAARPGRLTAGDFNDASGLPIGAARFLAEHPDAIGSRLFNAYAYGGYLEIAVPERKVFIDGRAEFFGPKLVRDAYVLRRGGGDTPKLLESYGIDSVIVGSHDGLRALLASRLYQARNWHEAYSDKVSTISTRAHAPAPPPALPGTLPGTLR